MQTKSCGKPCAIAGCSHYHGRQGSEEIIFFSFPEDKETADQWIHLCKRDQTINPATARVCSAHFPSSDFVQLTAKGLAPKRPKLVPGAVPTLFDCLPLNVRPAVPVKRPAPKDRSSTQLPPSKRENLQLDSPSKEVLSQTAVTMEKFLEYDAMFIELSEARTTIATLKMENERLRKDNTYLRAEMVISVAYYKPIYSTYENLKCIFLEER